MMERGDTKLHILHVWFKSKQTNCNLQLIKIELANRTEWIIHQCRKTAVLSCHRWLINTGVEKINYN